MKKKREIAIEIEKAAVVTNKIIGSVERLALYFLALYLVSPC